ncbi:MAG: hypothetical protein NVS9B15_14310 [Acidobacteriaceae bacterium]
MVIDGGERSRGTAETARGLGLARQLGGPASFLLAACALSSVGPLVPELRRDHGLSYFAIGALFYAMFFASLLTTTIGGRLARAVGEHNALRISYFAIAAGWLCLGPVPMPFLFTGASLIGAGVGLVSPLTNLREAGSIRRLNLLNASWTIGAICAAWTAHLLYGSFGLRLVAAGAFCLLAATLFEDRSHDAHKVAQQVGSSRIGRQDLLLACAMFLCVGIETGVSGWSTSWFRYGSATTRAEFTLAAFWAGSLFARFVAVAFPVICRVLPLATIAFAALTWWSRSPGGSGSYVALFMLGIALGPVFPSLISRLPVSSGQARHTALFLAPALGAMFTPFAVGALAQRYGLGHAVVLLPSIALALIVVLIFSRRGVYGINDLTY